MSLSVLRKVFGELDKDGNGYIERSELARVLQDAGVSYTRGEYLEMLEALSNEDEDGRINRDEFFEFFREKLSTMRNSKLNRLIVKPVIGRSRHSSYDLPGKYHRYGAKCPRDDESAKDVILTWVPFKQDKNHDERELNIVKMNKRAIRDKHLTPKEITEYNRAHPIYESKSSKLSSSTKYSTGKFESTRSLPGGRPFGRVNPKDEPIQKLVNGEYAGTSNVDTFYPLRNAKSNRAQKRENKKNYDPRRPTKASIGHGTTARNLNKKPASPFKMKRFQSVKSRVRSNFSKTAEAIVSGSPEAPEAATASE